MIPVAGHSSLPQSGKKLCRLGILLPGLVNVEGKGWGDWREDRRCFALLINRKFCLRLPSSDPPPVPVSLSVTLGRSDGFFLLRLCSEWTSPRLPPRSPARPWPGPPVTSRGDSGSLHPGHVRASSSLHPQTPRHKVPSPPPPKAALML